MSEDVFLLAAVLLPLVVLWLLMRPERRKKVKGAEPDPVCGCEHHLAFHTPDGVCKGQTQIRTGTDSRGYGKHEIVDCTCQQYVGPVPALNPQIMRELTNPSLSVEPYSQDK